MNINEVPNPNWYVDNGATIDMTNDPGNLISYSSYTGNEKIFGGDGVGLSISHAGNIVMHSSP